MSSRLERLPKWRLKAINKDPRTAAAYELLVWSPATASLADRARAKRTLGLRRTKQETLALLRELLERGVTRTAIMAELDCSDRHLRRLLSELVHLKNEARNPSAGLEKSDITYKSDTAPHPKAGRSGSGPPAEGFATFAELDRWLEENP